MHQRYGVRVSMVGMVASGISILSCTANRRRDTQKSREGLPRQRRALWHDIDSIDATCQWIHRASQKTHCAHQRRWHEMRSARIISNRRWRNARIMAGGIGTHGRQYQRRKAASPISGVNGISAAQHQARKQAVA